MWIDAHCHLADPRLEKDLEAVLLRSEKAGVTAWIQGGVDPEDWARQIKLAALRPGKIWTAFGLHPWWVARASEVQCAAGFALLENRLTDAEALGETGLDFSPKHDSPEGNERQRKYFKQQLELAKKVRKPLVLHIVHAHAEAQALLKQAGPFPEGGLVHAFAVSWEIAEGYLKLGFLISVGGAVTRGGYTTLKSAVSQIPATSLVLETDCPDLSPAGVPEGQNEPCHLINIAGVVGGLRGQQGTAVLQQSAENLRRLFKKPTQP